MASADRWHLSPRRPRSGCKTLCKHLQRVEGVETFPPLLVSPATKQVRRSASQAWQNASLFSDQRIGEILRELPTSKGGRPKNSSHAREEFSKATVLDEIGITFSEANRLEQLANNPDVVQAVLENAKAEGNQYQDGASFTTVKKAVNPTHAGGDSCQYSDKFVQIVNPTHAGDLSLVTV